jgi:hypothetical protein
MNKIITVIIAILLSISAQSQSLKLEEIMKGNAFIGVSPENERWSLDGQKCVFWNQIMNWELVLIFGKRIIKT